jgi:hypothetical protein
MSAVYGLGVAESVNDVKSRRTKRSQCLRASPYRRSRNRLSQQDCCETRLEDWLFMQQWLRIAFIV